MVSLRLTFPALGPSLPGFRLRTSQPRFLRAIYQGRTNDLKSYFCSTWMKPCFTLPHCRISMFRSSMVRLNHHSVLTSRIGRRKLRSACFLDLFCWKCFTKSDHSITSWFSPLPSNSTRTPYLTELTPDSTSFRSVFTVRVVLKLQ